MDNMGGLLKLFIIDADDYVSLADDDADNVFDQTLSSGAEPYELEFTEDTGKISEAEEETDNGIAYSFEASCRVPKLGPADKVLFNELRQKRIMIMALDSNGNWWLTGAPGTYFKFTVGKDTGAASAEMNGTSIKISAVLAQGSCFINELS